MNTNNNYYLYFELIDINIIKTLFESFDKNVDIVRLFLSKNNTNYELVISCINLTRTFHFKSKFGNKLVNNFISDKENIEIELLSNDLVNILKSYDTNDDLLLFYVENLENKKNIMNVEFKQNESNVNNKKKCLKEKKFTIKIAYPIYPQKQIMKINFDKKITIDTNKFYDICKNFSVLFNCIKISSKNNKNLYFEYNTSKCNGMVKFKYDDTNLILENLTNLKNNDISGVYNIKDIITFSKLSNITTNYYFKIKNNYLLELTHIVGNYGVITIICIPLKEDIIRNTLNYNDADLNNSNDSDYLEECVIIEKIKKNKTINDKIMYVEIEKIELFKSLCECIEKIITDVIFRLETKDNKMSIKIICTNNSKNINLDVCIENIFDRYKQLDKIMNLGICLKYLNDILKTTDKTDKLILSIDEQNINNLIIQIKKNNTDEIKYKQIYKIKLLNIEEFDINIKEHDYSYKICIDSDDFYKISKDINTIGEEIKMIYDDKNLIFSSINETKYINIIKKDNFMIKVKNNNDDNNKIINEFEIKDILIFSKLTLIDNLNLYLRHDGKLIIKSNFIDSMGTLKVQYLSKNILDIKHDDKNMLKTDIDTMDDKLIFFKLKKINFMKNIIETLDKMISNIEWIFTSKNNKKFTGLEIICTDPSKTLYVKTKLTDELFKSYYCDKETLKFAMNLEYFNKILKLVEKNDIALYCYIEKNDPANLIIRIKNSEKKNKRIFKIPLQIMSKSIDNIQMSFNFEKKITLKCENLFSKCKIISNNSQFIKICSYEDKLLFKCVGDKDGVLSLNIDDDTSLEIINLDETNVECTYEIKNILLFSKLSSITEHFSFYMKNNFALTMVFDFGICGKLTALLSPSSEEYINNQSYDYSDDSDDEIELLNNNNSNLLDFY